MLLLFDRFPFNADEAIVALMARHILLNGERPLFFYGQAYMGSLDAFLVAAGFALFGFQVWVIRAVQTVLYLLVMLSTLKLIPLIFTSSGGRWYTAALLALPTVNVVLYTTVSLGGYGEALLIGNGILYCGLKILRCLEDRLFPPLQWFGGLGACVGLGLWVHGLTGIYTLPVLFGLVWSIFQHRPTLHRRAIGFAVLVFVLAALGASLPWWLYGLERGFGALINELFGSAVAISQATWLQRMFENGFNLVLFGGSVVIGLRPPWEIRWLALPLAPLALAFWFAVLGLWVRFLMRGGAGLAHWMLSGVAITFVLAFVSTPFGADPSGRYFLPLWIVLTLVAGEMVVRFVSDVRFQVGLVALVALFNLWGVIECALRYPPGLTTQFDPVAAVDHCSLPRLIRFLREHGETRGYTNYWVAYPLAFLSEEEILFSPRLPYHPDLRYTPRDDRYLPYTIKVAQSKRVAYITTRNPKLDEYLTAKFRSAGVRWKEAWIGEYHVFYALSRALHPHEIGLGGERP